MFVVLYLFTYYLLVCPYVCPSCLYLHCAAWTYFQCFFQLALVSVLFFFYYIQESFSFLAFLQIYLFIIHRPLLNYTSICSKILQQLCIAFINTWIVYFSQFIIYFTPYSPWYTFLSVVLLFHLKELVGASSVNIIAFAFIIFG